MKRILSFLLMLAGTGMGASAQWAVFDGTNAVNMGVEIGNTVTQIQKASDMLNRFQQVSTAVTRCNRVRNSLTQTISDLNASRTYANRVALDATSARALYSYFRSVNTQITRSTAVMSSLMTSGKFSLDDQSRLEKLAQMADYMHSMSAQMKSVTRTICRRSRAQDNYNKLWKR